MSIDVATGALTLAATDIALAGAVPAFAERYYSSAFVGQPATILGPGWRSSLDYTLRQTLEGFAYRLPDGTEFQFEDLDHTLARTGRLRLPAAGLELRDVGQGRLAVIGYGNDRFGVELVFQRQEGSRVYALVMARNARGVRVEFGWTRGRIVSARQSRQRRSLRFTYDAAGRLDKVEALADPSTPLGVWVKYGYDARGRLVSVDDQEGALARYQYDAEDRLVSQAQRIGVTFTYAYDSRNRCVHASGPDHLNERWLEYDDTKRTTRVRDSHGKETVHELNDAGQVIRTTTPGGERRVNQYDALGRLASITYPSGFSTRFEYDALGRRTKVSWPGGRDQTFAFDDEHRMIAYTDWRGLQMKIERDDDGLVRALVGPDGSRWEFEYNELGELIVERDTAGAEKRFTYDAFGRIVGRRDPGGFYWSYEYDALGLLVRQRDPEGGEYRFEYDAGQRIRRRTNPDGTVHEFLRDRGETFFRERRPDGRERSIRYRACGQPVEVRDFSGQVFQLEWDTEMWRMLAVRRPSGATNRFHYDDNGDLVRHEQSDGTTIQYVWENRQLKAVIDPMGVRFDREYDELGHLVKVSCPDGDVVYTYDPVHCAIAKVEAPGSVSEYVRDAFGRVVVERHDGVELAQELDVMGRRTALRSSLGHAATFEYEGRGLCTSADFGFGALRFEYDGVGRERRRELGPAAGVFETTWDAMGRPASQRYRPGAGVHTGVAPGGGSAFVREFRYAPGGAVSLVNDSLRGWRRFVHDGVDRLMADDHLSGTTCFYGWNRDGNRSWTIEVEDNHVLLEQVFAGAGIPWNEIPDHGRRKGGQETTFRYDDAGRLVEARFPDRTIAYRWDAAGRLVRKGVSRPGERAEVWGYRWNAFGRLVELQRPDGAVWTYRYDGVGRRIWKIGPRPQDRVRYVWDGTQLVYEIRGDSPLFFGWEPVRHQLVATTGKTHRYVLPDRVGNPSEVLDERGTLVGIVDRTTWGSRKDGLDTPVGFVGQWYDEESGLFYNFQRYYDPECGRYISPDPAGLRGGLNRYAYVPSPEIYVDPIGEMRQGTIIAPASSVQTSRTQVNTPATGPYVGGHDTVDGQRVDLGGATVTDISDGDNGITYHAYNGREGGVPLQDARSEAVDSGASRTRWWHSEQNAATAILRGEIPLTGKGPIVLDISRPPCDPSRGHGCMDALLRGVDGPPLAQQIADANKRTVIVRYPDGSGDEGQGRAVHVFNPACG